MVTEMVRRDHENISEPRLIIFIDEVADLMEQGGKAMDRLMTRGAINAYSPFVKSIVSAFIAPRFYCPCLRLIVVDVILQVYNVKCIVFR